MTDKWAEYRERFCGCKDASRKNSCKGLPNCSLRETDPERISCTARAIAYAERKQDIRHWDFILKRFWNGRPKDKPLSRIKCPVYVFDLSGRFGQFVELEPSRYRPIDWRGLIPGPSYSVGMHVKDISTEEFNERVKAFVSLVDNMKPRP